MNNNTSTDVHLSSSGQLQVSVSTNRTTVNTTRSLGNDSIPTMNSTMNPLHDNSFLPSTVSNISNTTSSMELDASAHRKTLQLPILTAEEDENFDDDDDDIESHSSLTPNKSLSDLSILSPLFQTPNVTAAVAVAANIKSNNKQSNP